MESKKINMSRLIFPFKGNYLRTIIAFSMLLNVSLLKAQEPKIEFDNVRIVGGKIISNIKNKEGGSNIGIATEYTVDKYLFGTSADFNLANKKFASVTFDIGGGIPQYISDDMDFFLGISALSVNLNTYGGGPFNSAILLKLRFKKFVYEGKTTVWNWQKGKDPVFKENGYYGFSFIITKSMALGFQYKLYAEDAYSFNIHFGWIF
jgi:hypothetical protein